MATVSLFAADVAAAQSWHSELLGVEAYFVRPAPPDPPGYVEFRIGDYQPPTDREAGFVTAAVLDPFGNILGIMHNPHYREVLATETAS